MKFLIILGAVVLATALVSIFNSDVPEPALRQITSGAFFVFGVIGLIVFIATLQ